MSVESEILRIQHNIANTYAAVSEKGGDVPLQPNSANLAAAVASIPAGTGDTTFLVRTPIGTIVIWSGTADNIPTGWQLCDGTNGTPDLRDKFVLGAGTAHEVGEAGGEEKHVLTINEMPIHNHEYVARKGSTPVASDGVGGGQLVADANKGNPITATIQYSGGSSAHNNMPPYYALCYIMKLTADTTDQAMDIYSTQETKIGTWIDGKPLYRTTFKYTFSGPIDQWTSLNKVISDIDTVVRIYGFEKYTTGEIISIPERGVSLGYNVHHDGVCFYSIDQAAVDATLHISIEYTKTTDPAPTREATA